MGDDILLALSLSFVLFALIGYSFYAIRKPRSKKLEFNPWRIDSNETPIRTAKSMDLFRPPNPFPICTRARLLNLALAINELDPTSPDVELVQCALELSDLARWLISHAHQLDNGNLRLHLTINNPDKTAPEIKLYETMRANPL